MLLMNKHSSLFCERVNELKQRYETLNCVAYANNFLRPQLTMYRNNLDCLSLSVNNSLVL